MLGYIRTFCKFVIHRLKNATFSDILKKVNTYCFANNYSVILCLNPLEIPKMYEFEAP
jgi:hypothetical protein